MTSPLKLSSSDEESDEGSAKKRRNLPKEVHANARDQASTSESESADGRPGVYIIHIGHFRMEGMERLSNCTVTLIKGKQCNNLVDSMTAWDAARLQQLQSSGE